MITTRMTFTRQELAVLELALRGYLDGLDPKEWDKDHMLMEHLHDRVLSALDRLSKQ